MTAQRQTHAAAAVAAPAALGSAASTATGGGTSDTPVSLSLSEREAVEALAPATVDLGGRARFALDGSESSDTLLASAQMGSAEA